MLAALAPVGSAVAGEETEAAPLVPWLGVLADDTEHAIWRYSVNSNGLAEFQLIDEMTGERLTPRGIYFPAADGLRIGAQSSVDPRSGDLLLFFSLRLEF